MVWNVIDSPPTTVRAVIAEWEKGIEAKAKMPAEDWQKQAESLRSNAASLRDALLPTAIERDLLANLVDEITSHLPERRTQIRPE
jgi:hypothetical protein